MKSHPEPEMKTKEIFLLIMIILIGLTISAFYSGQINFLRFKWPEFLTEGKSFYFEEMKVIEPPFPEWLVISNPRGEVIANSGEVDSIEIYWEKQVRAKSEADARTMAEEISLLTRRTDSELIIEPSRLENKKVNFISQLRIVAPASLALKVENADGLVNLEGFKRAIVHNNHGQVKASHLSGEVFISNRHGEISLEDIIGPIAVSNKHGGITISKASEKVKIEASYGNLDVSEVKGELEIKGEHLSIKGRKIKGPALITTSYEPIFLQEIGEAKISNRYGPITIEEARGELSIDNSYSSIEVASLQGKLSISSKKTRVKAKSIRGQFINIIASYDNVELEDFEADTSIFIRHGNAFAQPVSFKYKFNFEGNFSSLRLLWPPEARVKTEIIVDYGKIFWQLDEPVSQFESNGETILRAFWTEEDSFSSVRIKTNYGQVTVDKAPPADK